MVVIVRCKVVFTFLGVWFRTVALRQIGRDPYLVVFLRNFPRFQGDIGLHGNDFPANVVVCGRCLVTSSLTVNEALKWLSSLPFLVQESFWW